jgi:hypothetical protein
LLEVLPEQARPEEGLPAALLEATGYDPEFAALLAWHGLVHSGAFVEGEWRFADDKEGEPPATLKIVGEKLLYHRYWGGLLLDIYAAHPYAQAADTISFIPAGPGDFARRLGKRLDKPVINTMRKEGGNRHDFQLVDDLDTEKLTDAKRLFVVEDILTTGSSVAAGVWLFRSVEELLQVETPIERIDALAVILRGLLSNQYRQGVGANNEGPHALLSLPVSRNAEEFRRQFRTEPSTEPDLPRHLILPEGV